MRFATLFAASLAVAGSATASYSTVKTDVATIIKAAKDFNSQIQATDGTSLAADFKIKDAATVLYDSLNTGTDDVGDLSKTLTVSQSKTLIKSISSLKTPVKAACKKLAQDKANYNNAGAGGPIKAILYKIADATNSFGAALFTATAPSQQDEAQDLAYVLGNSTNVCVENY